MPRLTAFGELNLEFWRLSILMQNPNTNPNLNQENTDAAAIRDFQIQDCRVRVISSAGNWLESAAVDQLKQTAALAGMRLAVGLPDLHPGKGCPIGAAFWSEGVFYPFLIGNDIGCGMALWQTDLKVNKIRSEKWLKKLQNWEEKQDFDATDLMAEHQVELAAVAALGDFQSALGSIGGGNHFAELQQVVSILDPETFASSGLQKNALQLLVHSGSRGLGEAILRAHTAQHAAEGLASGSADAAVYLAQHQTAIRWAQANRTQIQRSFLAAISATAQQCILEVTHNALSPQVYQEHSGWLHRKGAAPSDQGLVVIPGSRGAHSFLVRPLAGVESAWSLAHGAGRKWKRSDSRARLNRKYQPTDLLKTELGSWVICENRDLLYEEAPQAYKDIDQVVASLVDAKLVAVVAILKPVISYKTVRS